jgi:hypothetical protein
MRKTTLWGAALLLGGIAGLAVGLGGDVRPAAADPCVGNCVCPLQQYADHGSYCSYYAQNCTTKQFVNLNASCGLPPGNCVSPMSPPCISVGAFRERGKTESLHEHDPGLGDGIKKQPPKLNPIHPDSKRNATLLGAPMLAAFQTKKGGKATVPVQLTLILFQPDNKDWPVRVFANGVEVDTKETPAFTIPHKDLAALAGKRVCTLNVGSVNYEVILDQSTEVDPPE